MQALMEKLGRVALVLAGLALVFSATGCGGGHARLERPGWIIPK